MTCRGSNLDSNLNCATWPTSCKGFKFITSPRLMPSTAPNHLKTLTVLNYKGVRPHSILPVTARGLVGKSLRLLEPLRAVTVSSHFSVGPHNLKYPTTWIMLNLAKIGLKWVLNCIVKSQLPPVTLMLWFTGSRGSWAAAIMMPLISKVPIAKPHEKSFALSNPCESQFAKPC